MKTLSSPLSLALSTGFLLLVGGVPPLQAQPYANNLVTVTTNTPAAPAPAIRTPLVLQPIGIVKEVLKLQESGTDPTVIKAFVQGWSEPYTLTANDVLRLHNTGLSSETLTLMIQHGAELGAQTAASTQVPMVAGSPPPEAPAVDLPPPVTYPPEPAMPATPPPAPVEVVTYPQYVPVYTPPLYYSFGYGLGPVFYSRSFGYNRNNSTVHHFPPPRPFGAPARSFHSGPSGHQSSGNSSWSRGNGNGFRH
jgi:hypothetical protein